MNYSPLNDPGFDAYRKHEASVAASKRRKKTLIILSVVALIAAAATALILLAAFDAIPKIFGGETPTPAPTTQAPVSSTPTPEMKSSEPVVNPKTETPTPDTTPAPTTEPTESQTTKSPTIRKTTVYVDAGHGFLNKAGDAMDKGSGNPDTPYGKLTQEMYGQVYYESDFTIIMAKKVRDLLEAKGYTVIMSREDYVFERVPISDRAEMAKKAGADLLVSIHANAASPEASGTRIYYNYDSSWAYSLESKYFATEIAAFVDSYGASLKKTKVLGDTEVDKEKPLAMLRGTGDIPSVLIETFFMTNAADSAMAVTEDWQNNMARAIADAIESRYPPEIKYL